MSNNRYIGPIVFAYIKDCRARGDEKRVLTIARQIVISPEEGKQLFVAYCISNPKDQFSKKEAKRITRGLFQTGLYDIVPFDAQNQRVYVAALRAVATREWEFKKLSSVIYGPVYQNSARLASQIAQEWCEIFGI